MHGPAVLLRCCCRPQGPRIPPAPPSALIVDEHQACAWLLYGSNYYMQATLKGLTYGGPICCICMKAGVDPKGRQHLWQAAQQSGAFSS